MDNCDYQWIFNIIRDFIKGIWSLTYYYSTWYKCISICVWVCVRVCKKMLLYSCIKITDKARLQQHNFATFIPKISVLYSLSLPFDFVCNRLIVIILCYSKLNDSTLFFENIVDFCWIFLLLGKWEQLQHKDIYQKNQDIFKQILLTRSTSKTKNDSLIKQFSGSNTHLCGRRTDLELKLGSNVSCSCWQSCMWWRPSRIQVKWLISALI